MRDVMISLPDSCYQCRFRADYLGYPKCYFPGQEHTIHDLSSPTCFKPIDDNPGGCYVGHKWVNYATKLRDSTPQDVGRDDK